MFEHEITTAYRFVGTEQPPIANRVGQYHIVASASAHKLILVIVNGAYGQSSLAGVSLGPGSDHSAHNSDQAVCNEHLQAWPLYYDKAEVDVVDMGHGLLVARRLSPRGNRIIVGAVYEAADLKIDDHKVITGFHEPHEERDDR